MFLNRFILIVITVFLTACGGGSSNNKSDTVNSVTNVPEFAIVDDDNITTSAAAVTGSGSIVFADPLTDDAAGFKVQFNLVDEDSSITFYAFSDSKLTDSKAAVITLQKKNGELTGTLKISGSDEIDLALDSVPDTVDTLYIDVHNDEEPSHVLFWLKDATVFDDTSSIFNSEDSDEISNLGQKMGTGFFVGVKLNNASLKSLEIDSPRFED